MRVKNLTLTQVMIALGVVSLMGAFLMPVLLRAKTNGAVPPLDGTAIIQDSIRVVGDPAVLLKPSQAELLVEQNRLVDRASESSECPP